MYLKVDRLNIRYEILGTGKPVVLLQGWLDRSMNLYPLAMILSKKFKVCILDLPGFGMSSEPSDVWGRDEYAIFIKSFLDRIDFKRPIIIGHSFGGSLAIKYSLLFPKNIKTLILIGASGIHSNTKKMQLLNNTESRFADVKNPILNKIFKKSKAFIYNYFDDSDRATMTPIMRKIRERVIQEDLTPKLSTIKTESLIIWGNKDTRTPIKLAYVLHNGILNSKLIIVKDYTHALPILAPEVVGNLIIKFFYKWLD